MEKRALRIFKGLKIEKTDWDWEKEVYPVLHLDMSTVASKTAAELEISLQDMVRCFAADFDVGLPAKTNFKNLLLGLAKKSPNGKYVLLIDEYDAPIDFAAEFEVATLDAPDALEAPTVALLYQDGYLTIDKRIDGETVLLKIPNNEVRTSLYRGYIARLLGVDFELDAFQQAAKKTARELVADELGVKFAALLKTAFAKIPHEWLDKDEKEVKCYFLAFMVFARAEVVSEEQHSLGRPDSVVKTEKAIYIVEFKYAGSAEAALAQCREKRYADAYAADGRRVVYVGVNYDPAARTVDAVRTESAV